MEDETELLDELRRLEELLHTTEVRVDRERLDALLHPEVEEFGRSGKRYGRVEILAEFGSESQLPEIQARDYELSLLAESAALLTYVSAHVDEQGRAFRRTRRASLWLRTGDTWRLRFHQGTPINE